MLLDHIPYKYTSTQNPLPNREGKVPHYQLHEPNQNQQCNPGKIFGRIITQMHYDTFQFFSL
jgi:hypothetical protein